MKTALICGISGQDGAYLSQLLLSKNYRVIGTSRYSDISHFSHLHHLNIANDIELLSMAMNDFRNVLNIFNEFKPDEVYNLAGQSSVGLSFEQPVETIESIHIGTLNLLEAIRYLNLETRLFNAGSSECFGESAENDRIHENSCFRPRSPYAVAKSSAHWLINNYREAYRIYACTGHLFNHESPFRGERFVTKKIISTVVNIAQKKEKKLLLGNVDIIRDWGWAPEYVEAMWLMLQQNQADDFIIATGKSITLHEFAKIAFDYFSLDVDTYLESNSKLLRPTELLSSYANPKKIENILGWKANYSAKAMIKEMISATEKLTQ
ncbi:MAG: GDP-mannose 4,6-dehydratase [Gammaproteobacteria bacterium]|nr:GDP-mannose 4,6-dehydratase [Gammaproteobacteria bacterium]